MTPVSDPVVYQFKNLDYKTESLGGVNSTAILRLLKSCSVTKALRNLGSEKDALFSESESTKTQLRLSSWSRF